MDLLYAIMENSSSSVSVGSDLSISYIEEIAPPSTPVEIRVVREGLDCVGQVRHARTGILLGQTNPFHSGLRALAYREAQKACKQYGWVERWNGLRGADV